MSNLTPNPTPPENSGFTPGECLDSTRPTNGACELPPTAEEQEEQEKDKAADALLAGVPQAEKPVVSGKKKGRQGKETVYPEVFDDCAPPKTIWLNRRIGNREEKLPNGEVKKGVLHLCGKGSKQAKVLFIGPCVLQEELASYRNSVSAMLKGAPGNLFQRSLQRSGFQENDWFFTTLVKYHVPSMKPKAPDIRWSAAVLEDEIRTIKPKIIVCLGKVVFDYLWSLSTGKARKFSLKDVQGGFFQCDLFDCVLYPMDTLVTPLLKPEYLERFLIDLRQVKLALDDVKGVTTRVKVEQHYVTINTVETLANVVAQGVLRKAPYLAVDCEWHGQTWISGQLRSFQWCWEAGHAAYLRLMDDKMNYCFNAPIETVRRVMQPLFHAPGTKLVGHNAAADMPWMFHHLGIPVYKRFWFDTMFAQHTVNEYADMKLERLSVKFTDLGRYDIDLCLWKKDNKFNDDNEPGYGRIPDRIIIPYGQRDVDATYRSVPFLWKELVRQGLLRYYQEFLLPFVTDGFFEMMDAGLPINAEHLDDMREVFSRNQTLLEQQFRLALRQEAVLKLYNMLTNARPDQLAKAKELFGQVVDATNAAIIPETGLVDLQNQELLGMIDEMKSFVGVSQLAMARPFLDHFLESDRFNINSTEQVKRWLFNVKGLRPIKTTKKDGIQIAWEKVEGYDPQKRAQYQPAADKQTIKVYAERDLLVAQLQELKAVGNICKAFLKGPDEEGREQGIPKWIQPDGRIHANFALTETARPRAWKPNILNWPKAVTKPIEAAFGRIQKAYPAHAEKPNTLRSVVQAPPGWVIIDMDLKTAEVVALAYQAGDQNMINVLTEPDKQFARIDPENPKKCVRIAYNENSCYPESAQDPALIVPENDSRILRTGEGQIIHPKRDLHWEMGEGVAEKPREKCDERMHRDGCGKVGNFSIPYGATGTLLERMIESNTGHKPEEGTGDRMIATFANRYPEADKFLREMELTVEEPGHWRSLSGRVRHFFLGSVTDVGLSEKLTKGIRSPLSRQARNFPMQELVAATTGKALLMFIEQRRKLGLDSRIGLLLYDAMTAFAPLEQAKATAELLKNCLTTWCPWTVQGRTFNFEVDVSYYFRWGAKMTKEEKERLTSYL